jgi:site-specific DNA-methyltransferase (adenine-specific)/modification methylase
LRSERIGEATLYLGDCHDLVGNLGTFDALVTDPPYGLKEAAGKSMTRPSGSLWRSGSPRDYGSESWDNRTDQEGVNMARDVSRHQIIFGGNYYDLPPSSCWLVWDKQTSGDQADCELAWTNLKGAVRLVKWCWNGIQRRGGEIRFHPTQKPVGVMTWCIERLPDTVETILDPYMGSGTTGVAAHKMGKQFVGIEQLEKYFDIACRRIEDAQRQDDLFVHLPS